MKKIAGLILPALLVLGCNASTEPDSSRGNAPVITGFTFSPESTAYYPWGDSITIRGNVGFTDSEGDIVSLLLSIIPGGELTIAVTGAAGATAGTVAGEFRVATGAIGAYTVTVTLIDARGNRSNPASKVFRVSVDRSGSTWGYRVSGTTADLSGVAAGDSVIVAVGAAGTILTSSDGRDWEQRTSGTTDNLRAVTWTGQEFVAVGDHCTILASSDAVGWTTRYARRPEGTLAGVAAGGGLVVAVGGYPSIPGTSADSTFILTSPDGFTWTERGPGLQHRTLQSVAWSGSRFVAGSLLSGFPSEVVVLASVDGITWTPETLPGMDYSIFDIVWTGSSFVTAGTGGVAFVSSNGATWQRYTLDATHQYGIAATGGRLVTVGWDILLSDDGGSWARTATQFPEQFRHVIWHDFQYIAVGEQGKIIVSPPGGA